MDLNKKSIEMLFQRPMEPSFTPRDNGKAIFDIPASFYSDQYLGNGSEIQSRYSNDVETRIPVRDIEKPNLDFIPSNNINGVYSLFNPSHKQIATRLIDLFMAAKDVETFIALAVYVKDRVNPYMFQYVLAIAVLHRTDLPDVRVPPVVEQFPNNFIEPRTLRDARNDAALMPNPGNRVPLETPLNYTASDREEEQRMAYFREDIGLNLHHWHWHLIYPSDGPREIVDKDRRGELFYYMHHQMLARYNVDRFCNLLGATKPLSNLREPIKEGYFPKLINSITNRTYASRIPGLLLQDLNRTEINIEVSDVERWINRIQDAIDEGSVIDTTGKRIVLDDFRGIDVLFNIIESSALSVNRRLYGDVHNLVHLLLSVIHDPDSRFLENPSVMADVSTSMRDPIFYRWHAFIDSLGNKHKALLDPYSVEQLNFVDIVVDAAEVKTRKAGDEPNILTTFWQKSDIDLGRAMDFAGPSANSFVRFTHLQNDPFDYTITVTNRGTVERQGTCRIFLIPKSDERLTDIWLEEKRLLAIELDKFYVTLKPGQNRIMRRSEVSSVTIPFQNTFRRLDMEFADDAEFAETTFCGCGWPEHLLLPKGTPDGRMFDMFVMISDYVVDSVVQTNTIPDVCDNAASFCGLKDKLYPDKRSMGYPFDRRLPAATLVDLTNNFQNMRVVDVRIVFKANFSSA